jgi:hypothetical protein
MVTHTDFEGQMWYRIGTSAEATVHAAFVKAGIFHVVRAQATEKYRGGQYIGFWALSSLSVCRLPLHISLGTDPCDSEHQVCDAMSPPI